MINISALSHILVSATLTAITSLFQAYVQLIGLGLEREWEKVTECKVYVRNHHPRGRLSAIYSHNDVGGCRLTESCGFFLFSIK